MVAPEPERLVEAAKVSDRKVPSYPPTFNISTRTNTQKRPSRTDEVSIAARGYLTRT